MTLLSASYTVLVMVPLGSSAPRSACHRCRNTFPVPAQLIDCLGALADSVERHRHVLAQRIRAFRHAARSISVIFDNQAG